MSYLFDNALRLARQLNPDFQPGKIIPQKRPTSKQLQLLEAVPCKVLVGYQPSPIYTRAGTLAKRQPKYVEPGSHAYVKLQTNGEISIMPFAMAGSGYEIVDDAEEGVHFEF